jgi:hypothetical protein
MSTAQLRAARRQLLEDLLRLAHRVAAGELSREQYSKEHQLLCVLLREVNEAELALSSSQFQQAA